MNQAEAVEVVASLAEGQWGMFTTAQAENHGVPRTDVARLVRRQLARRLRHGVHMMPGVPSSPFEDIRAEWLATDPVRTAGERRDDPEPVIVSDESAALIHGMGDLPPGGVHLTSARRLQSRQQWVTIHRRHITDREYDWVDGLPVATPRRTLEDLAESGRWEQSQLRALANDAIAHGLIPASDLVKSATLARVLPELAAPASHTALRQRLSNDARERGVEPREAYSTFFRMMFTNALMEHEGWVLKGGTNLLCRLRNPRNTLDLDLFRQGDRSAAVSAERLHTLMDGRQVGRYTFRLGAPATGTGEAADVLRLKVSVLDGTTTVESFNIDLSADIVLNAEPDLRQVPRGDTAVLPGYPAALRVRLYPIENQIADKLSAMYATYGSGPSTRYRDLYDLAMIVDQLPFDEQTLIEALRTQQQLRRITIPSALTEPARGWADAYDKQMAKTPSTHPPFTTYQTAITAVRAALGPAIQASSGDSVPEW
jgi:hypothetical protein